ncbi:reticulon-4-like isoform X2 [Brienomyrus brachyistius]|uniref:reticulon-4-like isoform X2 n=1 Tax=Brienomyrus brachyistius TaxID=42636 RepID=UPI0020B1FE24|nr:reticulon-4-like isoform X2 [Brienomyrus brachyistius]
MEDGEQISSTTPFESGFGGDWMAESRPAAAQFHDNEAVAKEDDDILDLAGGAKEALERHRAYDYDSTPFGQPQKAADPSPMPPASMDAGPLFGDAGVRRMPAAGEAADTPPKPQVPEAVPVIPAKKTQSPSPSSDEPSFPPPAPSQTLMHSSAAKPDAPFIASCGFMKDVHGPIKDIFSPKASWRETDLLASKLDVDDDFLDEVKAASATKNPFQGFSPIGDSSSVFPQLGEMTTDISTDIKGIKVSESPTPDLVPHAHEGEPQDAALNKPKEEATVDLVQMASDPVKDLPDVPVHSVLTEESKEPSAPPSLPDILKSSPLIPEKIDSGSSEASSDNEQSPTEEVQMDINPMTYSATNPFAFDTKISLLKEMAEETEARAAAKEMINVEPCTETSFGAFDLLKEAETTKGKDPPAVETEQKDWNLSGSDSVKFGAEFRTSPASVNLPIGSPSRHLATAEESDSESPMTDSLSPVLEAMAKNPASFQIESESKLLEESKISMATVIKGVYMEEHETSEHEVSSEEFEFIERPPKGVMDEFLETLDSAKFAKAPEMGTDDDASPGFGQGDLTTDVESALDSQQSSYMLLTQPISRASPQKLKADLEKPFEPSELVYQPQEAAAPPKVPLVHSVSEEPEKPARLQKTEDQAASMTAHTEASTAASLAHLSAEAVVDLLYWRDVKTTGVVFGAALFLLLSLSVCSIISVCSYVGLALLSVTITFRIYKGILQAVQKSDEGHPFKTYLTQEVTLSEDLVHKYSDMALTHLNCTLKELRRLFLVEDLVDSLKFAVLMWILTYIGALFNGLTLLILGLIAVFSTPVIYEKHQAQIDHYLALARTQIKDIFGKVQAKVPGMKPKAE